MKTHVMSDQSIKKTRATNGYTAVGTTIKNNGTLNLYFRDIADIGLLSAQEEAELAKRIRCGDQEARDRLVKANLRFVIRIAREHQNCSVPIADLISAGNLGLLKAAEQFDEKKGVKFITYAVWWIRQAIYKTLAYDSRSVRLPANRIDLLQKISKTSQTLHQQGEDEPEMEAIAEELGVSTNMVEDTMMWAQDVGSLDDEVGEDGGCCVIDKLADLSYEGPETEVMNASVRQHVEKLLDTLDKREAEVIRLYCGFDDEEPLSLQEIGNRFDLTRERIRQIKEKALGKLKRHRTQLEPLM